MVLGSGFSLTAETGLTNDGTTNVAVFNSGNVAGNGLFLSEDATLTFEYLGTEATFNNSFAAFGSDLFSKASTPGETVPVASSTGMLDFLVPFILTSGGGGTAENGVAISTGLSFALADFTPTSVIVLFDDSGTGTDYDDFAVRISVSQVPLPPAVWLLLSAILGLVSFSRIRRGEARAV